MTGLRLFLAMIVLALIGALPVMAGDGLLPTIPKARGEKCVEDAAFMRRNHMQVLKHHRDETMHQGIRTTAHSLNGCLNCHAVDGADGKPVTVANEKHFCKSCHTYAAVSPDCFQCHSSTPGPDMPDQKASR
ncbi:MAG: Hdr-like menaquinol oxidoreductase cytochrome c subunit [Alphaproteobacteria bacterium]